MRDTIRRYLKRRVWWCAAVAVVGWLLFPLAALVEPLLPDSVPKAAIPAVGVILFAGAVLTMQWTVRCPKCKARLGQTIAMPLAFSWGSGPKVNFCPYCGVNLDEAVQGASSVPKSQDPIHPV
jgi:hypothetical protein